MIRTKALLSTVAILLIFGVAAAVQTQDTLAQGNIGSISGAVYRDVNANGICTAEDEPGVTGIPLQFVNRDDDSIVNLTSGSEGYFELIAASAGTWSVTVNPGTGWRVTSQQTRQVLITEEEPDIEEVDFCIVQVSETGGAGGTAATATPGPVPTITPSPVLPESGAAVSPAILSAAAVGLLLLISGAGLFVRSRSHRDGN